MTYLYLYSEPENKRHIFLDQNEGVIVTFGEEDTSPPNQFKLSVGLTVFISAVVRMFNNSFLIDKRSMLIIFIIGVCFGFIFQGWIIRRNTHKKTLGIKRVLAISQTEIMSSFKKNLVTIYKFTAWTLLVEIVLYFINIKNQNLFLNFFLIVLPIIIGMGIGSVYRMKQNEKEFLKYWEKGQEENK